MITLKHKYPITALQYTGNNLRECELFIGRNIKFNKENPEWKIGTWLIQVPNFETDYGHHCATDILNAEYELGIFPKDSVFEVVNDG